MSLFLHKNHILRSQIDFSGFQIFLQTDFIKISHVSAETLKIMDDKSWIPNGAYFGGKNPLKHFWLGDFHTLFKLVLNIAIFDWQRSVLFSNGYEMLQVSIDSGPYPFQNNTGIIPDSLR